MRKMRKNVCADCQYSGKRGYNEFYCISPSQHKISTITGETTDAISCEERKTKEPICLEWEAKHGWKRFNDAMNSFDEDSL